MVYQYKCGPSHKSRCFPHCSTPGARTQRPAGNRGAGVLYWAKIILWGKHHDRLLHRHRQQPLCCPALRRRPRRRSHHRERIHPKRHARRPAFRPAVGVRLTDVRLADPAHFRGLSPPRPLHRQPEGVFCHDLRQRDRQRRQPHRGTVRGHRAGLPGRAAGRHAGKLCRHVLCARRGGVGADHRGGAAVHRRGHCLRAVRGSVPGAEGRPARPVQDRAGEHDLLSVVCQVRAVHGLGCVHRLRQVRTELPGQRHRHRRAPPALERRVHALHDRRTAGRSRTFSRPFSAAAASPAAGRRILS